MSETQFNKVFPTKKVIRRVGASSVIPYLGQTRSHWDSVTFDPRSHDPFLPVPIPLPLIRDFTKEDVSATYSREDDSLNRGTWIHTNITSGGGIFKRKIESTVSTLYDKNNLVKGLKLSEGNRTVTISESSISGEISDSSEGVFWKIEPSGRELSFLYQENGVSKYSYSQLTHEEKKKLKHAGFNTGLIPAMYKMQSFDNANNNRDLVRSIANLGLTFTFGAELLVLSLIPHISDIPMTGAIALGELAAMGGMWTSINNLFTSATGRMDGALMELDTAIKTGNIGFILNGMAHWLRTVPDTLGELVTVGLESGHRKINPIGVMKGHSTGLIPAIKEALS